MSGSRTSNFPGEGLRPPRRVSTTLPVVHTAAAKSRHALRRPPPPFFRAPADSSVQMPPQKRQYRGEPAPKWCVGRLQPPVSTRSYRTVGSSGSRLVWCPPLSPNDLVRLTASGGYAFGTMGPPLMRTEHFRCGAAVAISAGSRRISGRVASFSRPPSLAVGLPA